MPRRGRPAPSSSSSTRTRAGGRARNSRRSGSRFPWIVGALVVASGLAVFALSKLERPEPPAPPPGAPVAGIEAPEVGGMPDASRPAKRDPPVVAKEPRGASASAPVIEVQPEHAEPAPPRAAAPIVAAAPQARTEDRAGQAARAGLPRVAIVLDDCGQRLDLLERASRIRQPLTFAVIPHLSQSRSSAEAAFAAGHEVIVHQPMEPESGDENPGEGVLRPGMSRGGIARVLRASLADVPHAVGLNNHMGSRATSDAELMGEVLGAVADIGRSRPLYFLDSRTSARTVALEAARRAGVPSAERDVFLDNDLAPSAILGQVKRLLAEAAEQGTAVGIGHLKPETLAVLESALPAADGTQVRFVFLGDLVR